MTGPATTLPYTVPAVGLAMALVLEPAPGVPGPDAPGAVDGILRPREIQVLRMAANGRSNKEIGKRLGIAENTVKSHMAHLTIRLGARNRTHAALIGVALGLVDPQRITVPPLTPYPKADADRHRKGSH
ncbi:helix-turn-helix transcriptional regulator [Streptomyces sp. NPDC005407]|uniref:response regulator transcription factor n=1 Tax=Streptomyces sp. NPDC005407 TaxID=3155340 RepID=UPI0033B4BA68